MQESDCRTSTSSPSHTHSASIRSSCLIFSVAGTQTLGIADQSRQTNHEVKRRDTEERRQGLSSKTHDADH